MTYIVRQVHWEGVAQTKLEQVKRRKILHPPTQSGCCQRKLNDEGISIGKTSITILVSGNFVCLRVVNFLNWTVAIWRLLLLINDKILRNNIFPIAKIMRSSRRQVLAKVCTVNISNFGEMLFLIRRIFPLQTALKLNEFGEFYKMSRKIFIIELRGKH